MGYFDDYVSRPKPNREQRRKRTQERRRQARGATRAWQREQDARTRSESSKKKGDD